MLALEGKLVIANYRHQKSFLSRKKMSSYILLLLFINKAQIHIIIEKKIRGDGINGQNIGFSSYFRQKWTFFTVKIGTTNL